MRRVLQGGTLLLLAWAIVQVSIRAMAHDGSGQLAEIRALTDEQTRVNPIPSFQRAVALSPREAMYHARLGLALETNGQFGEAEKELMLATQLSRKYEPRWDLLNFYFRRAEWDPFWRTAASALAISWGDRSAFFELALQAEGGRTRLEQILPERRDICFSYAAYMIARNETAVVGPLIPALAASASMDEKPVFLNWIDALLQHGQLQPALQTWRALGESEDPFPWKPQTNPGVTIHATGGWQILLNGSEPEHCVLMESIKPVTAGAAYQLQASMEEKLSPSSGLTWHIETMGPAPRVLQQAFTAPPDIEAVRIRLEYQRPQGSVRAEGEIRIHSAHLQKVQ